MYSHYTQSLTFCSYKILVSAVLKWIIILSTELYTDQGSVCIQYNVPCTAWLHTSLCMYVLPALCFFTLHCPVTSPLQCVLQAAETLPNAYKGEKWIPYFLFYLHTMYPPLPHCATFRYIWCPLGKNLFPEAEPGSLYNNKTHEACVCVSAVHSVGAWRGVGCRHKFLPDEKNGRNWICHYNHHVILNVEEDALRAACVEIPHPFQKNGESHRASELARWQDCLTSVKLRSERIRWRRECGIVSL